MTGEREPGTVTFRDPAYFADLRVELALGSPAIALDLDRRRVVLEGEEVPFDGLILATGAVPRILPGCEVMDGVHTLRSLDDAVAIRSALDRGPHVVVVGAGFIGSEVAASARTRGLDVTVLEMLPVPLVRAVGEEMGRVCASLHLDHGTDLRCGVGVEAFQGAGRVDAVRLSDGTTLPADLVVVGVGVQPATGWLTTSGLTLRDGVVCDAALGAGPPSVFGAGDIVRWDDPRTGLQVRVEHWTNAVEQGMHAARNLLAGSAAQPFSSVPYFWSDQYGVRIQLVGLPTGEEDEVRICHGSVDDRTFVALYRRGGRLVAAFGMNSPKLVMQYRTAIAAGVAWEDAVASADAAR